QMRAMHDAIAAGKDPRLLPPERLSIAASRIADVTGIPRETVRRKLSALRSKGWIEQTPTSAWRLVVDDQRVPARSDLNEINERSMIRISRLFAELETLL